MHWCAIKGADRTVVYFYYIRNISISEIKSHQVEANRQFQLLVYSCRGGGDGK